jgi:SAM-dependent methyltransferase
VPPAPPPAARDPKERFTDRVDDYVRYRPSYPPSVIALLEGQCGLGPACTVADLGSGTGILTRLLLDTGARVIGVEPNAAMRASAEKSLGHGPCAPRFESVDGSAESTTLADQSVDLVTAAQAFHWFDPARSRAEMARILRPAGFVALVWNQRKDTAMNRDYEEMLERFAPEYAQVRERDRAAEPGVRAFFAPSTPSRVCFDHAQRFDEAGLRGRLSSSSYAPREGHPSFQPMMKRLDEIFAAHARGGEVSFAYEALVWYGRLAAPRG